MSTGLKRFWRGAFAAGFVGAMGFGATEAVAGPNAGRTDPVCEEKCWNTYRVCVQYNLGDCQRKIDTCLYNCST